MQLFFLSFLFLNLIVWGLLLKNVLQQAESWPQSFPYAKVRAMWVISAWLVRTPAKQGPQENDTALWKSYEEVERQVSTLLLPSCVTAGKSERDFARFLQLSPSKNPTPKVSAFTLLSTNGNTFVFSYLELQLFAASKLSCSVSGQLPTMWVLNGAGAFLKFSYSYVPDRCLVAAVPEMGPVDVWKFGIKG